MSAYVCVESPNPLPLLVQRETGLVSEMRSRLFPWRLAAARNMYRRDLICHYGCVNAIEFSANGEYLVSGGDDRRIMFWKFSETMMLRGKPEQMRGQHQSNVFCLGVTQDNSRIYSGGNDNQVIVHDTQTTRAVELLPHQRAVCGLTVHPQNTLTLATAGNDGRLLYFDTRHSDEESLVIARSRKAFHAVMFHPTQSNMLVSANARDGVAMWDLRANKQPVVRYTGHNGCIQNSMSVRFNQAGTRIVALRRRQAPVLYAPDHPQPIAEFTHQDYHNSCTMKSCSFAGADDEYVLSGSDDFNLYMWRVPEAGDEVADLTASPLQVDSHVVLYGHRSIVNQVSYNKQLCLIASSGVEKIIKIWSTMEYPGMYGSLLGTSAADNPREVYTHENYVSLVHQGGQFTSHNLAEQSTSEDPRMMAFFDSLVQREAEGLAESVSDSESDGDSDATCRPTSDSDSDQIVLAYSCVQKRAVVNGRNQRCTRASRRLPTRHNKHVAAQGARAKLVRRSKQARGVLAKPCSAVASPAPMSKRVAWRSTRSVRLPPPAARRSAPSSERTDSDEPSHALYRHTGKIIRPLRRRMNLSRTFQRKPNNSSYRKIDVRINEGDNLMQISPNVETENSDEYMALPSTSSGYRGQNSCLFRIAEVDSDDDHSLANRPDSVKNNTSAPALNLVGNAPFNGSHDSLPAADSLRSVPESTSNPSSPTPGARAWMPRRSTRRCLRSGAALRRSDSSESPSPIDTLLSERLSYSPVVRLLLDETNESEMESSCSTSAHSCASPARRNHLLAPDPVPGSSASLPCMSEDPHFALLKFRQRVKRARRNYRSHTGESDSN